jgi:hypothetical protein
MISPDLPVGWLSRLPYLPVGWEREGLPTVDRESPTAFRSTKTVRLAERNSP